MQIKFKDNTIVQHAQKNMDLKVQCSNISNSNTQIYMSQRKKDKEAKVHKVLMSKVLNELKNKILI